MKYEYVLVNIGKVIEYVHKFVFLSEYLSEKIDSLDDGVNSAIP